MLRRNQRNSLILTHRSCPRHKSGASLLYKSLFIRINRRLGPSLFSPVKNDAKTWQDDPQKPRGHCFGNTAQCLKCCGFFRYNAEGSVDSIWRGWGVQRWSWRVSRWLRSSACLQIHVHWTQCHGLAPPADRYSVPGASCEVKSAHPKPSWLELLC